MAPSREELRQRALELYSRGALVARVEQLDAGIVADEDLDQVAELSVRARYRAPMVARGQDGSWLAIDTLEARAEALAKIRAGEILELEFDARTYLQSDTPNRNHVRIRPGKLAKVARSGRGTPFLTDHAWADVQKRGGTVVMSVLERGEKASAFLQTIRLVKPWAVEGVLDGTIDRFSIGWVATADVVCTVCGTPILEECFHFPGDEVDKEGGTEVVLWEFTDAELVEVSGVNVPAVVGTGIDEIRAALAAHNRGPGTPAPARSNRMSKSIRQLLGLPETASDDEVEAALEKRERERELALARATEAEGRVAAATAAEQVARRAAEAVQVNQAIARLYQQGKLVHGRDAATGKEAPSAFEPHLRQMAEKDGLAAFNAYTASMPQLVPAGAVLATTTEDPIARASIDVAGGEFLANPALPGVLSKLGLTVEDVKKHGDLQGLAQRGPQGRLSREQYVAGDPRRVEKEG